MNKPHSQSEKSIKVIGMMSGTSLDGVDLAFCQFTSQKTTESNKSQWKYRLIACHTFQYPKLILQLICKMQSSSIAFIDYKRLQIEYTSFIIQLLNLFTTQFNIEYYDLLSVHGHTMFHQPGQRITIQAINLNQLAGVLKVDVCGNFRELDVFRGGQGAPLAPFGQQIFFGDAFLNFGGIANLSYQKKGCDINFCNLFLNYMSEKYFNCKYDKNGELGRQGTPKNEIINYFIDNSVFKLGHSLARQEFEGFIIKMQRIFQEQRPCDIIASYYHFLSSEIVQCALKLIKDQKTKILCTGGGAKNLYLLQLINAKNKFEFILPDADLIDFKEAIIFAFLGVKFLFAENNCSTGVGGTYVRGSLSIKPKTSIFT